MAQHTASVDYVNDGVLRTNPHLLLVQSHHAVLGTKKKKTAVWNLFWELDFNFHSSTDPKTTARSIRYWKTKLQQVFNPQGGIIHNLLWQKEKDEGPCYLKNKFSLTAVSLNTENIRFAVIDYFSIIFNILNQIAWKSNSSILPVEILLNECSFALGTNWQHQTQPLSHSWEHTRA